MWFDQKSYLQTFARDIHQLFIDNDWRNTLKYRITNGVSKFIEVKIYESLGSDNELRKFGTAYAYDTQDSDFPDNRYISNTSPLGSLGLGDGVKVDYQLECFPIVGSTLVVFQDGIPLSLSAYTANPVTGTIKFTTAPTANVKLTCEYQLHVTAHEPSNDFQIFTFNRFSIEKKVLFADTAGNLGNGNGTKTVFNIGNTHIDETRFSVRKGAVTVPFTEYTLDAIAGTLTFNVAPASSDTITVEYTHFVQTNPDGTVADFIVPAFDNQDPKVVIEQVYKTINFHQASPPMNISFNPVRRFTNEWQRDSDIFFYGNINKDRIIMFLRVDPTGNPIDAYFVPLYIGKIHTIGEKPRKNMAMFSGCRTGDDFKWVKDQVVGNSLLDYGVETSNGNSVATLQQSLSGAMYQQHYFAFITHDKEVDNGQGRYNPSLYSGKYHLSQIFLVHPNDGYVGKLDDVYAVHPKNIQQADELEIVKEVTNEEVGTGNGSDKIFHIEHRPIETTPGVSSLKLEVACVPVPTSDYTFDPHTKQVVFNDPPVGEILAEYQFSQLFRYTLPTTPVSPCTQDKATPFNPIGLAIYKEEL